MTTCPGSSGEPLELGCLGFPRRPGSHRRGGWRRPPPCSTGSPGLPVHHPGPRDEGLTPRPYGPRLSAFSVGPRTLPHPVTPPPGWPATSRCGRAWPEPARSEGPPAQAPVGSEGLCPTLQLWLCPYFPSCGSQAHPLSPGPSLPGSASRFHLHTSYSSVGTLVGGQKFMPL